MCGDNHAMIVFHPGDMVKCSSEYSLSAAMWDHWATAMTASTSNIVGHLESNQVGIVLATKPKVTSEILVMSSRGVCGWISERELEIVMRSSEN